MTPKEKYNEEKDELKTSRMNRILETAFNLFSVNGIDNVAMTDIAKKAEIGVASLYRYYATKDEIAIRTVIWAWEKQKQNIMPKLSSQNYENLCGLEQIKVILNEFISLYENEKEFLRFIYFFDSYAVRTNIPKERLSDYENQIGFVQSIVNSAISKGLQDNTIDKSYKEYENSLYFSIMHSFFSTCQKLSLSGNMLKIDEVVGGKVQLELLSKIIISGLS